MVESKLSKCATKFDHCICRAYQRHGCGDHDDCETNRFCEKIVSRFVLKILTADIPKMRPSGLFASRLSQCPCQLDERHYNTHWKRDLALLSELQLSLSSPVLGQSRPN